MEDGGCKGKGSLLNLNVLWITDCCREDSQMIVGSLKLVCGMRGKVAEDSLLPACHNDTLTTLHVWF